MEIIEQIDKWREHYERWRRWQHPSDAPENDIESDYPFVVNRHAPFVPARRALPMLNLALVTSAGAYIDGSEPFNVNEPGGDVSFREIPVEVEAGDLQWATRGYSGAAVREDINSQVPVRRLQEFEGNGIIGQLNPVWWSFCGFITDAARLVEDSLPRFVERVNRYEVQAALLVPASRLCHQSMALAARALERAGIPTMMLCVDKATVERVRAPRGVFYDGEFGSVSGKPNWPEHQRRLLDEALRLIEPMDQVGVRKLVVELETSVEIGRGEK